MFQYNAILIKTFFLLLLTQPMWAQQYFKWLEKPARSYDKRITRFPNGDLLIGDTAQDNPAAGEDGGVIMTRLDACGNVLWANRYAWGNNYLEFKDFTCNDQGEIFIYGSAYQLPEELIFILKVDRFGAVQQFRLFETGTIDHFTYSINWDNGRLMMYGLLLGWQSQKEGFLVVLDEGLQISWGTKFNPFASFGAAIITRDQGFLCRSGAYLVKLTAQGDLQWATTLETGLGTYPVAGPVETDNGYIFEFLHNEKAFLYKVGLDGQLLWQSRQFPSADQEADIAVLPDGKLIAAYNHLEDDTNDPSLVTFSPDGEILQQQKLVAEDLPATGKIYLSVNDKKIVNYLVNADLFAATSLGASGFLLQFPLDSLGGSCFSWETFREVTDPEVNINFNALNVEFSEAPMPSQILSVSNDSLNYLYQEICEVAPTQLIRQDTLLQCREVWKVELSDPNFVWADGSRALTRVLDAPGIYSASNDDCLLPKTYEFRVDKEVCECSVFVPNAFSPNNDGINDELQVFSDCILHQLKMSVFNRWGDQVFAGTGIENLWDGTFNNRPASAGLYVVRIQYAGQDESGNEVEGSLSQGVMLVK